MSTARIRAGPKSWAHGNAMIPTRSEADDGHGRSRPYLCPQGTLVSGREDVGASHRIAVRYPAN